MGGGGGDEEFEVTTVVFLPSATVIPAKFDVSDRTAQTCSKTKLDSVA